MKKYSQTQLVINGSTLSQCEEELLKKTNTSNAHAYNCGIEGTLTTVKKIPEKQ